MKKIKTIKFNNITEKDVSHFKEREASRAIVFDEDKNIGILYVSKYKYHKLPGGGVESEESRADALKRECLEEIGCNIKITDELGEIIEYRDKWSLKQHSYCYIAKVVGEKLDPSFTEKEKENGFLIKWIKLSEALQLLENDNPKDYEGMFIKERDASFLRESIGYLEGKK